MRGIHRVAVVAIAVSVAMSAAPARAQVRKGTYLTATSLGDHGQLITGYWRVPGSATLHRIELVSSGTRLVMMAGQMPARFHAAYQPFQRVSGGSEGTLGQYAATAPEYRGLRATIEKTGRRCQEYEWWMQTVLTFDRTHMTASESAFDPEPNELCEAKRPPSGATIRITYQRFVGVTFAQVSPGRYLASIMAPAVGNQPAQYKGTAKLQWDYSELQATSVIIKVGGAGGGQSAVSYPARGTYDLVATQPGTYNFELQVTGPLGSVTHIDYASAVLPGQR